MPNETYKHLGIIAIILTFSGLIFLIRKWPQGKHRTYSQHAAAHKASTIYYPLLFTLTLPILLAFFYKWLIPTYKLSFWFGLFIAVSALLQYICSLIPETDGWNRKYHRIFAFASAQLLIPPTLLLGLTYNISLVSRLITFISLLTMITIFAFLVKVDAQHKHLLLIQTSYYIAFFTSILSVTYLG